MRPLAFILFVAAVLCGCVSGPSWTRRTFAFSTPVDLPATNGRTNIVALTRVSISPLFQSRSFTYRTADGSYEQDPYAGFLISPEGALAESIRALMRAGGVFGRVVDADSGLTPSLVAEVSINQLYGDFRKPSQPLGTMEIHFLCYELKDRVPGRVVLDKFWAHQAPLARKTPEALMAAWDTDLRAIMEQFNSEYAKATSKER
jgi:cholesterol transport system auxiliary component